MGAQSVVFADGGLVIGYSSAVYYFPATDTTITILWNCANSPKVGGNWAATDYKLIHDLGTGLY